MSTALWIAWAALVAISFYLLEKAGIRSGSDTWYSLTNRIRALMRLSPFVRALLVGTVIAFATFLVMHFIFEDPFTHPGAFV